MKVAYITTARVNVTFDGMFAATIEDELNKIQDVVEDFMWHHNFKTADICSTTTGELLMTIEKDY